jgi:diguanylate cyclase (GGDEF)-like protein
MDRQRLHVLLIEDDADDHVLVRDLLADLKHVDVDLDWETTYEGGRAALRVGDHDICLMDYRLGARDGIELLRELGAGGPGPLTPIIFLTGQDSRDLDVEAMEAGAADYLVKGKIDPPLLERAIRYALERQRLLLEMHRRALVDELTGVLNRRGFEEQMAREMKLARRRGRPMALLFVDIDEFKSINDEFGHAEGDHALREVADLLTGSFRGSDLVARLGGDEFVVVALDTAFRDGAIPEQRLRAKVAARNASTERPYQLSLTFGFSLFEPDEPCQLWELVARADREMYVRKPMLDAGAQERAGAGRAAAGDGGARRAAVGDGTAGRVAPHDGGKPAPAGGAHDLRFPKVL